jgi:hypothetical protein
VFYQDTQFRTTSGREPVMQEKLRFWGLDVHAEMIAVAIAEPEVRSLVTIKNRTNSLGKLLKKLGLADKLRACYGVGKVAAECKGSSSTVALAWLRAQSGCVSDDRRHWNDDFARCAEELAQGERSRQEWLQ